MMPSYFIPLLLILLFACGWLFRRPLASSGGKIFTRIFVAVFAVAGAVAWTLLLLALKQIGNAIAGAGDGAGTGSTSVPPEGILLAAVAWLVPVTAFAFMLLGALNVLRGALRHIGYWYALIFLVVAGSTMMVLFPHYYIAVKWIGLAFMLVAVLWSYAFRQKSGAGAVGSTV
jgi:hypothetical protein